MAKHKVYREMFPAKLNEENLVCIYDRLILSIISYIIYNLVNTQL